MMDNPQALADKAIELGMQYAPKVVLAILTLLIGLYLIGAVMKVVSKSMERAKLELTLQKFLESLIAVVLKVLLLISVASMIGIETTSFIAILGAAGLAVGFALQGSLSNFAGGILILFFKPFKVGDVIEAQGFIGSVKEIQIFTTILRTGDNRRVIIPNSQLSNGTLVNINVEGTRRVDMEFSISYTEDIQKAKDVLMAVIKEDSRVLAEPGTDIFIRRHADSAIIVWVRTWVKAADYWPHYFSMHEKVKIAFDKNGIVIPFPQRDVHIHQVSA